MISAIRTADIEANIHSLGEKSKEKFITCKRVAITAITTVGAWGITDYLVDEFLETETGTRKTAAPKKRPPKTNLIAKTLLKKAARRV